MVDILVYISFGEDFVLILWSDNIIGNDGFGFLEFEWYNLAVDLMDSKETCVGFGLQMGLID